jgi:hypothetical protein
MRVTRTITAILTALALALAPTVGGFASAQARAGHAMAPEHSGHATHMHGASDHASMPCCPDEAPVKKASDCATMSGCALCFGTVTPAAGPAIASPLTLAATLSWSVAEAIPPPLSSGPFRPPRS